MSKEFLIFDIWGDYAHFRKYYTTSSPLSFSIPPRSALIGLISAIIGIGKDEYLDIMRKEKAEIAIRIINPVHKIRMTQNLINTKGGYWIPFKSSTHEPRTQIRFEYLKNPKYRIYFHHLDDEINSLLKSNLENHKSVYTPYLGISELIADFTFISKADVSEVIPNTEFVDVHSVVPLDVVVKPDLLQPGRKYFKERIPCEMLPGRIVTEYREVLYEIDGKPIKAKVKNALKLNNDDVIITM
jgi:CRISPR-associated protein Cas5h